MFMVTETLPSVLRVQRNLLVMTASFVPQRSRILASKKAWGKSAFERLKEWGADVTLLNCPVWHSCADLQNEISRLLWWVYCVKSTSSSIADFCLFIRDVSLFLVVVCCLVFVSLSVWLASFSLLWVNRYVCMPNWRVKWILDRMCLKPCRTRKLELCHGLVIYHTTSKWTLYRLPFNL